MAIPIDQYLSKVKCTFAEKGDVRVAEGQRKYMRDHFDFYGLKAPVWLPLAKSIMAESGIPAGEALKQLIRALFAEEYRELHYFALEMVQKVLKKQEEDFIYFLEALIQTQSWWDSVDWIAKLAGIHFKRFPQLIVPVTGRWMQSENIWLQRSAIIFQLTYKEQTDEQLLFQYIRQVAHSKEFFLQKAAGWALRQYSKTNPVAVRNFIENTRLAPLTVREGLRLMID